MIDDTLHENGGLCLRERLVMALLPSAGFVMTASALASVEDLVARARILEDYIRGDPGANTAEKE